MRTTRTTRIAARAWGLVFIPCFASTVLAEVPQPELGSWRGPCYNCYNYATNVRGDKYFAQPGGGVERPVNAADIIAKAESDGLTYIDTWNPGDPPPVCKTGCLVAAALCKVAFRKGPIWCVPDYHWYRLNGNGTWSSKPGEAPAEIFRNDGENVIDPATADRNCYDSEFVGYFCVPDSPSLSAGESAWDLAPEARAIRLQFAGLPNPVVTFPTPSFIIPHLPTGAPIPEPDWPTLSLSPSGGYAFLAGINSGLPFAYLRVFEGVVAVYGDLDGANISYYVDNNGLGGFLAGHFTDVLAVPTFAGWGEAVLGLSLLTGLLIKFGRRPLESGN